MGINDADPGADMEQNILKRFVSFFIIFLIVLNANSLHAQILAAEKNLVISGRAHDPIIIRLDSLDLNTGEAVVLNSYKVEINGIKKELEIFRKSYLILFIGVMYAFINAISNK